MTYNTAGTRRKMTQGVSTVHFNWLRIIICDKVIISALYEGDNNMKLETSDKMIN